MSNLEMGLFDSVEFFLALLGTIPGPILVVNSDNRIFPLNRVSFDNPEVHLKCSHAKENDDWGVEVDGYCLLCETIKTARENSGKVIKKGAWRVFNGDSIVEYVTVIHAVAATIKNEQYVIVAIEDLTELELLKGLLPICMKCNKIFDKESDRWTRIDEYISDRTAAKFSHGVCPCCSDQMLADADLDKI